MKVLVVPDLHGRTGWKRPVTAFLATAQIDDQVVFLGDYNDSFSVADRPMLANFRAVLRLKQQHPTQIVLLLGNHCLPYLFYPNPVFRCPGFRSNLAPLLAKLYQAHASCFQVAFAIEQTLLVHAGVSWQWLAYNARTLRKLTDHKPFPADELARLLNTLLDTKAGQRLLWQTSSYNGGLDRYDSPLWVRPDRLLADGLLVGLVQVVGHTEVAKLTHFNDTSSNTGYILTDCLANPVPQWLTLDFPISSENGASHS